MASYKFLQNVFGDIFEIDTQYLKFMDWLEFIPHMYQRDKISVVVASPDDPMHKSHLHEGSESTIQVIPSYCFCLCKNQRHLLGTAILHSLNSNIDFN